MNQEFICYLINGGLLILGEATGHTNVAFGGALPTTSGIRKLLTIGGSYDTGTSKWGCVPLANEQ